MQSPWISIKPRADAGLVLTEWKRAGKEANTEEVAQLFANAREQA